MLSSGEFYKLRYDTIPVKSSSANVPFYTNNSKKCRLWHSCRKWGKSIVLTISITWHTDTTFAVSCWNYFRWKISPLCPWRRSSIESENCFLLGYYARAKNSWPLKTAPIRCPETSLINYHYSLCNSPDERGSNPLRHQSQYQDCRVCRNDEGCNVDSPWIPDDKVPITPRNYDHNIVSPYQWNSYTVQFWIVHIFPFMFMPVSFIMYLSHPT